MNNNKKQIKLAAVAVMSLIFLAGCTDLPGKQTTKNNVEQNALEVSGEIGETIKQDLGSR